MEAPVTQDRHVAETRALVVGSSGGIGRALVEALERRDVAVAGLSRRDDGFDLLDEASIVAAVAALPPDVAPRLVVIATGLLQDAHLSPEKNIRDLDAARLARSFAVNAIGPALVAKHVLPLLPRAGRSVFAVLSARVGSIADNRRGGWYGYRASKAALNQLVRTLAIETRRTRPDAIIVALHPGTVDTGLSAPFLGTSRPPKVFNAEEAAGHLLDVIDGLTVEDSGGFFAWDGSQIPF